MPIRKPTAEDARGLAVVHVCAWQAAYAGMMPADFLDSLTVDAVQKSWSSWLAASEIGVRVLEVDDRIAGFCTFSASRDPGAPPEVGEIQAINLHPDFWRQGLGTELLAAGLRALRSQGSSAATLWVLEENASARSFYEVGGWQADGGFKVETRMGGQALREVRYRIALRD